MIESVFMDWRILDYIIMGILGGVTYAIAMKWGWHETADILRRVLFGTIAGVIVFVGGLPNHLNAYGLGFAGTVGLEAVLNRVQEKRVEKKEEGA